MSSSTTRRVLRALPFELRSFCCPQALRYIPSSSSTSLPLQTARHSRRGLATAARRADPDLVPLDSLPTFLARGRDIKVLYEPAEFYDHLLRRIRRAKRRVFLASLYIGKEESELVEALHQALRQNTDLELDILVDGLRSTREHPRGESCASLIASLHEAFPRQVRISLYHTPALSGLVKRLVPKRYNEGWGLWHGKIYGFDDDVIISGANLSRDYFTNRQDRYMVFKGHSPFANYMHGIVREMRDFSYELRGTTAAKGSQNFDLRWPGDAQTAAPEPTKSPKAYSAAFCNHIDSFRSRWSGASRRSLSSPSYPQHDADSFDTRLRPFLQMGPFGINEETEVVVSAVIGAAQRDPDLELHWTSGYFSLRTPYRNGLLQSAAPVNIVCASPEANGFFQSPGFSKYLPPAYTYMESQFWREVKRRGQAERIRLSEWKKAGCTYHAKGIWLAPKGEDPKLTLIGSTNFGHRSAVRDLEVNVAVQTTSPELRSALRKELVHIQEDAQDEVNDALFARPDRRVGPINRWAARAISDML